MVVLVDQAPGGKLTEKKLVTLIGFKLKVEDRGGTMFRTLLLSNTKREPQAYSEGARNITMI